MNESTHMKALSLFQPWAMLVVLGHKRCETRCWQTEHRGPLLIHASGKFPAEGRELCRHDPVRRLLAEAGIRDQTELPRGILLGTVQLRCCVRTEEMDVDALSATERLLGDYGPGRWVWLLEQATRLAQPPAVSWPARRLRRARRRAGFLLERKDLKMPQPLRNRIKRHARLRAGDLVPHELNPRLHTPAQRQALAALYEQIGFARSLLAYELPDGRLKLIDGHLRAQMDPDQEVEVEVLDVDDSEARALLLSIDPLAQLAGYDAKLLDDLRQLTQTESAVLAELWDNIGQAHEAVAATLDEARQPPAKELVEQWLILVECGSEVEQTALLAQFQADGLKCRALLS